MRISFDVDDTLICREPVPREPPLPWWFRLLYPEPLRAGSRSLMKELLRRRWEIWLYTTSLRSPRYLRGWLARQGVPLGGVVNQDRHLAVVGPSGPSKYPPAFGIDLHVDDSEGVAEEGRRHGFTVVRVDPADPGWADRVLAAAAAFPDP